MPASPAVPASPSVIKSPTSLASPRLQMFNSPRKAHLERIAKEAHSTSGRRSCLCFGGKSAKELRAAMAERTFYLNDGLRNSIGEKYKSNYIRTTKYTSWNFLPLSLLNQFKRKANIYFLLQAILNSIPAISALNPVTAILPLAFVLGVSMLREGLEDYQRYKSDVKTNR